ncbi:MAG: hypothetical protein IKL43_02695 [Alistipes sp.]|nr:hypothetical protein [Alistipes sp.]
MNKYQMHDAKILQSIYSTMCICENLHPIRLSFGAVGKGGGKCTYTGNKPLSIKIDLTRISMGAVYVLCHEVAHQIEILNGNATHNKAFKRTEARLVKKYSNSVEAQQLYW